ncbi:MAG: hypothetical protein IT204_14455 [Fimbriimonadaceae bacterium]|nr:hypothetical protein [Fimbriimonadaceae bacterium]
MGPQQVTQDTGRVVEPRGEPARRAEAFWLTVGMTESNPTDYPAERSGSESVGLGEVYEAHTTGP